MQNIDWQARQMIDEEYFNTHYNIHSYSLCLLVFSIL